MMRRTARPTSAIRLAGVVVVLVLVYVLGMLNFWSPVLRFGSPLANAITFAGLQVIPFALLTYGLTSGPFWARVLSSVVTFPLAGFAGLLGVVTVIHGVFIVVEGRDASFEPLEVLALSSGQLATYRTDGGATTSFGISVRHECRIVPGVLRVRQVWSAYPAYEAQARVLAPGRIRFSSPAYENRRKGDIVEDVTLRPLWCPAFG